MAARQSADVILDLASEMQGSEEPRFWEHLAECAAGHTDYELVLKKERRSERNTPMTEEEAAAFERTVVPFGIHAGEHVGEVDPEYWAIIAESAFNIKLVRYMRSQTYRRKAGF